jgi:hypothetical protein
MPSGGGLLRKPFIVLFLFSLSGILFAQTDYFFLVEKPASPGNFIVSAYQTLVASLATDVDTVSAVAYSGASTFLFAPMPGDIPDLPKLAAARLAPETVKKGVSNASFAEALALADEQALAWGRPEAEKNLIIIAGAATSGKIETPARPSNFSGIYYLSLDSLPEQGIAAMANPDCVWAIDSENSQPADPQFISLTDGLFNCIKTIAPRHKRISPSEDFAAFSAGNFLFHARKAVVLARHSGADPVELLKNGQPAQDASIYPQSGWTVMQIAEGGSYAIENGEAALVVAELEISALVIVLLGSIAIAISVVLLIIISVVFKGIASRGKPVFEITVLRNSQDVCPRKPQVCVKKKSDDPIIFESGAKFKDMFKIMGAHFPNNELSNIVEDEYPQILFDKKEKWIVKFNSKHIKKAPVAEKKKKLDIDSISLDGSNPGSQTGEENAQEEITTLESDTVKIRFDNKNQFEVKNIFKKNSAHKLFLKKIP